MDIAAVSSALSAVQSYGAYSTGSIAQTASIKMLDNTMEMSEAMNTQLIQMMEQSVNPNLGGNIDIRVQIKILVFYNIMMGLSRQPLFL